LKQNPADMVFFRGVDLYERLFRQQADVVLS